MWEEPEREGKFGTIKKVRREKKKYKEKNKTFSGQKLDLERSYFECIYHLLVSIFAFSLCSDPVSTSRYIAWNDWTTVSTNCS